MPGGRLAADRGNFFADVCRGAAEDPHKEIGITLGNSSTVITHDGYRLTLNTAEKITGQMFCLKDDPQEQHNLYDDPDYAEKAGIARAADTGEECPGFCAAVCRAAGSGWACVYQRRRNAQYSALSADALALA